jgi:Protein of unknown function (DUF3142)
MAIRLGRNSRTFIGSLVALYFAFAGSVHAENVRAQNYSAFWLWAGVNPQPVLKQAQQIYVLAGEVTGQNPVRIISQRSAIPRIENSKIWIVYRAQTIAWNEEVLREVLRQMAVWKANGNSLAGLQIDFDAGTKHLERYAAFLKTIRSKLPREYALSVTGLLDWSANGDPAGLDGLAGVADEVVLQIYQGRKVIPGYAAYLQKLDRLKLPFRIGLLQSGEWQAPEHLADNPMFRGYVVFLLNERD